MVVEQRIPTIPITEIEQSAFCQTDEELRAKTLEEEFSAGVRWQKLPVSYMRMSPEELDERIAEARAKLGDSTVILGHHYQRDEVIKYADYRGDSFNLSQYAASQKSVENIIFCGVHFMAETADILSAPYQRVILPNLTAGCSMADMARIDDVLDCWDDLQDELGDDGDIIPITYMNSTAAIKAHCGRNGGIVCTSSNAPATFDWALERGRRILFLPDQHLGRNTGLKMGIGLDEMVVWNPFKPLGGNTVEELAKCQASSLARALLCAYPLHCAADRAGTGGAPRCTCGGASLNARWKLCRRRTPMARPSTLGVWSRTPLRAASLPLEPRLAWLTASLPRIRTRRYSAWTRLYVLAPPCIAFTLPT